MTSHILRITLLTIIMLILPAIGNEQPVDQSLTQARTTWDEFVSSLRVGDMPAAYARISKSSRRAVNYRDFCVEWHPVGIKYNTVLSNPNYSDFTIYGDIAAIRIGIDANLNPSESSFIRVLLEKDGAEWFVVDEKVQDAAISKASICGVMRDIVKESRVLNTAFKTGKGNFNDIENELPRIFSSERGRLALSNFTLELDLLRDGVLRATPKKSGLLGYEITEDGILSEFKPSDKQIITAEAVLAKRERLRAAEREIQAKKIQQRLASAKTNSAASKPKSRKVEPENPLTAESSTPDLPDLPPDFPMDFNKISSPHQAVQNKIKLKYLDSKEDFDLPEIDIIAPSISKRPAIKAAALEDNFKMNENRTMAGKDNDIHSNTVNLHSEELLEELEMMISEYEHTDPLRLQEGRK